MRANWIKIVFFVLAMFMLAGITQVLLDPGLGKPDESRRTRHPAGFSFVPPNGWGASVFYGPTGYGYMRVAPEKSTGRQPSIGITQRSRPFPAQEIAGVPFTFQNQPAMKYILSKKKEWVWFIEFERAGKFYSILMQYPTETRVEGGLLWPFIDTFRVEKVIDLGPATAPASELAREPAPMTPRITDTASTSPAAP